MSERLEEKLFKTHEEMIHRMAKRASIRSGVDEREFVSVGFEALMRMHELHGKKPSGDFLKLLYVRLEGSAKDLMRRSGMVSRKERKAGVTVCSLQAVECGDIFQFADMSIIDSDVTLSEKRDLQLVKEGILLLSDRDRLVLMGWAAGKTNVALAREHQVVQSRICQLRTRAIKKIRKHISERRGDA